MKRSYSLVNSIKRIQLTSLGQIFEWQKYKKSTMTGRIFFQKNKTQLVIRFTKLNTKCQKERDCRPKLLCLAKHVKATKHILRDTRAQKTHYSTIFSEYLRNFFQQIQSKLEIITVQEDYYVLSQKYSWTMHCQVHPTAWKGILDSASPRYYPLLPLFLQIRELTLCHPLSLGSHRTYCHHWQLIR